MLSRTPQLVRLIPRLSAVQSSRTMGAVVPSQAELIKRDRENNMTMDALPVPEGSWQESYEKKQREYNLYLAATTTVMFAVGFFGQKIILPWTVIDDFSDGWKIKAFRLYNFEVPDNLKP